MMLYGEEFEKLYQSTINLHNRFELKQEPKQAFTVFREEIDEVLTTTTKEQILEELVDVIVTLFGIEIALTKAFEDEKSWRYSWLVILDLNRILTHYTETFDELPKMTEIQPFIDKVIVKNDAKTSETHTIVAGKITRKTSP